jgi:tetratricopeptide (TPR) repeat protein
VTTVSGIFGLGLLGLVAGCSVLEPAVARQVDGVVTEGRYIDPEAYSLYAAAALREARGELPQALALYQRALDADGRGPELRTRIGAVACKLRQASLADRAFGAAARSAADYGPLWFELALCRRSRGDVVGAERAALHAVELDPERAEASLLAADLADQAGNHRLAWQLRDGLATRGKGSVPIQTSILNAALKDKEPGRAWRARAALEALARRAPAPRPLAGVESAVQAIQRGDLALAKLEAERRLGADPGDGNALLIALVIADLDQDEPSYERLLASSTEHGAPASPELLTLLAGLLERRVGADAAKLVRSSLP